MKSQTLSILSVILMAPAFSQSASLQCGMFKDPAAVKASCGLLGPQAGLWMAPQEAQWVRDIRGFRSDFVNIYVHGTLDKLEGALVAGGWTKSLDNNKKDNSLYVHSVLTYERAKITENETEAHVTLEKRINTNYLEKIQQEIKNTADVIQSMPVSNEFMCGQLQTAAFEKQNNPFGGRHHLRIWDTGKKDSEGLSILAIVGSHDIGIMFDHARPGQFFLNHRVEPNADLERDIIIKDLKVSDAVASENDLAVTFPCPAPKDKLFSADQRIKEIYLK